MTLGPQSVSYALNTVSFPPSLKQPRREDDHIGPSSEDVKNAKSNQVLPHTPLWREAEREKAQK